MDFLPEEQVLYDKNNLGVTLTTHRVRAEGYLSGNYFLKSIMLEKVASVAVSKVSYPGLLFLGLFAFIFGILQGVKDGNFFLLVIGLMLFISYFFTIKTVLEIASCGAFIRIKIPISTDIKEVKQFIEILEDAKDARYTIGKQD